MVNTNDPFLDLIKQKNQEKTDKYKDALLFGHSEAHTDSGRSFVQSLQDQFNRKGYLTEKQVEALYKVDSERVYNSPDYSFDEENGDDDHFDQQDLFDSDFAGGDPSW